MSTVKALSFSCVVNDLKSTVRMTDDGYIVAVDLVMAVTGTF
jgi:hypothetical protein